VNEHILIRVIALDKREMITMFVFTPITCYLANCSKQISVEPFNKHPAVVKQV